MNSRHYWLVAIVSLALLVIGNWWLNRDGEHEHVLETASDRQTDYVLSDFRARFFDAAGDLEFTLAGPLLEHDAATRQALVSRPQFSIDPGGQNWSGSAERGILERDTDQLKLRGGVVLIKSHPRGTITIRSEHLHYDRTSARIHSPGTAHITQDESQLTGGTLTAWINDDRMELENDVHAIYRAGDRGDRGDER